MNELYLPIEISADNESSLQQLAWAIEADRGDFALILVRCNYERSRRELIQRLPEFCAVEIREITLDESVQTLYNTLKNELGDEQPSALMVIGLESVTTLDRLLTTTNQVREEFRKNFSFPVVLWVTDAVLQKLIRLAPDFESWATTIEFAIAPQYLLDLIQKTTDEVFTKILDFGAGIFIDNAALNLEIGSPRRNELESAWQKLQSYGINLSSELEASLEFVLGRDAGNSIQQSREHYERSLALWQQQKDPKSLIRQGCVLQALGLSWRIYAERHRAEYDRACLEAKNYFHQSLEVFEQAERPDLVAKFINALGATLQRLQHWDELETVAQKAFTLHQTYANSFRLARAYSFLAEVALAKSSWLQAREYALQALQTFTHAEANSIIVSVEENTNLEWMKSLHQGWYFFALARAQKNLGQIEAAIEALKTATAKTKHQYDPELYIQILEELRECYFKQNQYFEAFKVKQEQRAIEQQYSFRAFIGAGRLQPKKQVTNPPLPPLELQGEVAPEIAASGRQKDIDRLLDRLGRNDYKLTVIHGQSGVGKSSIIQAGLIPALKERSIGARNVLPVCQRVYADWVNELGKRLTKAFLETRNFTAVTSPLNSIESILKQLRENGDRNLLTVLIFDQFEELFCGCHCKTQKREFYQFLQQCFDIPYVKVILGIREDYLHYLLEFNRFASLEAINNNILDKDILYYLGNFSAEDARSILQKLTQTTQFYLDPSLIDKLVEDLAEEMDEVRPIELQVVGSQLQTEKITTLVQYQEYGSKEKLVEQFLGEVVRDCGVENERVAKLVMYLLTDEQNSRPIKNRTELEAGLKALGLAVKKQQLDLVLNILPDSGLIFTIPETGSDRYQLVHDYLVFFIRQQQEAGLVSELRREKEQRERIEIELNQMLKKRLQEARLTGITLAILAVSALGFGLQSEWQKQLAKTSEIQALTSASQAFLLSDDGLGSLLSSIKASKRLQVTTVPHTIADQTVSNLRQAVYEVQEYNRLEKHNSWISGVSFSPDGKIIATASRDKTVKLWSSDGTLLKILEGHNDWVTSVSFSPDGKTIASGSKDKTVRIWKIDGTLIKVISGHNDGVWGVSFSPDGKTLASASADKTIIVWSKDGKFLTKLQGHDREIIGVTFSPNSKTIASASYDRTVKLWSSTGKLLQTFTGHKSAVWGVSFSPDGKTIASASYDKTLKLWHLDGKELRTLTGHNSGVWGVSFSPDGETIASTSSDNTVKLWRRDGTPLQTLRGHSNVVTSVSFSPDSKTLASASYDNTVKLWKLKEDVNQDVTLHKIIKGHEKAVTSVSFSPDGKTIAAGDLDGRVKLWQINGTLIKVLPGRADKVLSVSFSPDGRFIASGNHGTLKLWQADGTEMRTWQEPNTAIFGVSFSSDSRIIAAANENNTVKLRNIDGTKIQTIRGHQEKVLAVKFSPDGRTIASASDDATIKLWTLDGRLLKTLSGHKNVVNSVSFSPDGKTIASASDDTTVKLWNLDRRLLKTLQGHRQGVWDVKFSPNGKIIATASSDNTIKLWNRNGDLLRTLRGHNNTVRDLSFSPDGKLLASASEDKTIMVWKLNILNSSNFDNLLVLGCDRIRDYLKTNPNVEESDRHLCDSINRVK